MTRRRAGVRSLSCECATAGPASPRPETLIHEQRKPPDAPQAKSQRRQRRVLGVVDPLLEEILGAVAARAVVRIFLRHLGIPQMRHLASILASETFRKVPRRRA